MKTGLCTIAFRDRPFEAVLDLAVEAGFDGVEPWGKPDHTPDPFDADIVKRAAEAVQSRGLEVAQYGSYANPTDDGFDQQLSDAIEIADIYRTDMIRVWVGNCGSADAEEDQWNQAIEGFKTFCDRASDRGKVLVVEMHGNRLSDTVDGCMRLIEGVDRGNFRMNFQPMYTESPDQALDAAQAISPYVSTVHTQNYVQTGSNQRTLIAEGLIDYRTLIGIFRTIRFDGYLEVEFVKEDDPEGALKADAAFLRELCDTL